LSRWNRIDYEARLGLEYTTRDGIEGNLGAQYQQENAEYSDQGSGGKGPFVDRYSEDFEDSHELRRNMAAAHNARIAEAEKAIAAKRSAAMANVESMVTEITSAIVEKLTGVRPARSDVADAVTKTLKR